MLQRRMLDEQLDAFVIGFGHNVRYLTGFTGSNGVAVIQPDRAVLFTDPRCRIQAAQEADCPVRVVSGPIVLQVAALLRRLRVRRVGFERSRMSVENFQNLRDALPMRSSLEAVPGWVEQQRMLK